MALYSEMGTLLKTHSLALPNWHFLLTLVSINEQVSGTFHHHAPSCRQNDSGSKDKKYSSIHMTQHEETNKGSQPIRVDKLGM